MIDSIASHLARRSFEAHYKGEIDLPGWTVAYLIITSLFFFGILSTIRYAYGDVIATLLMVESPSAALYVPVPKDNDPDAPLENADKVDPEVIMVKEAPITSGIYKAEKHLIAVAGPLSRFRGLSIAIFQKIATWQLINLFIHLLPRFLPRGAVAMVVSQVIVSRISTGWTHIVISEPSSKYWFRRIPSFAVWKKVAGPTFVLSVAEQVALYIPVYLVRAWGMNNVKLDEIQDYGLFARTLLFVVVLGLATTFLVVIPARVTLTRVQASLLSEEEETIVPFDRSFGGKVVPESVGGSGVVGMLDAWKTFGFHSRVRLIKLYAKVIAMEFFVFILWVVIIVSFLIIQSGPGFTKAIANAKDSLSNSA